VNPKRSKRAGAISRRPRTAIVPSADRPAPRKDLVFLAADQSMELAVSALLRRRTELGIRDITFQSFAHPRRDPGCRREAHDFLRRESHRFSNCLVIFDREGCGRDDPVEKLEAEVERNLGANGWEGRCRVVVIVPELDIWVWSPSPALDQLFERSGNPGWLRTFLEGQGYWSPGDAKPGRPKEAFEAALRAAGKARSAAHYGSLAERLPFESCRDPAFQRLRSTLRSWFPAE